MNDRDDPYSIEELRYAVAEVNREIAAYFAAMPAETFFARFAQDWSPAENLVHLIKSVKPVAMALQRPRWQLILLFGIALKPSRRYLQLREDYLHKLGKGAKAPARFVPILKDTHSNPTAAQDEILNKWRKVGKELLAALALWPENRLDRMRLPHPLLGKLTVREMVCFTLYHNLHHMQNVRKRLEVETTSS